MTPAIEPRTSQTQAPAGSAASAPAAALDRETFTIGLLGVTAVVLFVALVLLAGQPPRALGMGTLDRAGDYILITQQLSNSQEGVVVIDAASKQMNLYALDNTNKQLRVINRNIPLEQLPGAAQGAKIGNP